MLIVVLLLTGVAGEVARLLHSSEPLSGRIIVARMITGGIVSLSVLAVRVRTPDAEDLALVGLGAVAAVLGYSFLEPLLRRILQTFFNRSTRNDPE